MLVNRFSEGIRKAGDEFNGVKKLSLGQRYLLVTAVRQVIPPPTELP